MCNHSPNGTVVNGADKEHAQSYWKSKGREVPVAQRRDFIQSHPLVKHGLIDIADVYELVFKESAIWRAVEEFRRGGDEAQTTKHTDDEV